jgi:hypothetical protein
MARDTLTLQVIGGEGAQKKEDLSYTAYVAANDQQFLNDGNVIILIKNGGVAQQDVVVASVADPYGRTQDLTVATTNAKESVAGPFPPALWNQSDGYVYLNGDDEDTLNIAAIQLPHLGGR